MFNSSGHRLYQRISSVRLAYVWRTQCMPSVDVSSVCLAYDERMSNVLIIRSHTLKHFEHVQTFEHAHNNVHRRMSSYEECTRRMPSVPLTCIYVCERMLIRWHTLML